MKKILSVVGTRPEAVKMAPIIKTLAEFPDQIISRVCVTAQHREMLDQTLRLFHIQPDYDLNLMQPNQTLDQLTARIIVELTPILQREKPDWVLVQGDTTTVMAGALVAFYAGVRVGHVEAGLRTFSKTDPFPEEINRRLTSVLADLHFAPTPTAQANLLKENIPADQIIVTGNPVIDALQWVAALPYEDESGPLAALPTDRRLILVTAHRRENLGQRLEQICTALQTLAAEYKDDVHIVYPVHLNPHVQEPVYRMLGNVPNITLLPPLDYLPLVHLMKRVHLILTDSGGIQEEAPSLGKPVLVLRDVTERGEAVEAGTVRLVGADTEQILAWTRRLLDQPAEYQKMAQASNPYGDGQAAQRIVQALLNAH